MSRRNVGHFEHAFHPGAQANGEGPLKGLRFMGGLNIAPGCELLAPDDAAAVRTAVDCWFRNNEPLLLADGESPSLVSWDIERTQEAFDGMTFVWVRQSVGRGIPADPGGLLLVYAQDGRPVYATARLLLPSQLPASRDVDGAAAMPESALEAQAEIEAGRELEFSRRYFDVNLGLVVAELGDRADRTMIRVDASTGALLDVVDNQDASTSVHKRMKVYTYQERFFTPHTPEVELGGVWVRETNYAGSCYPALDRGYYALEPNLVPRVGHNQSWPRPNPWDDLWAYYESGTCGNDQCFMCNYGAGQHQLDLANVYLWASDLYVFAIDPLANYRVDANWTQQENVSISVEDTLDCGGGSSDYGCTDSFLCPSPLCEYMMHFDHRDASARSLDTIAHEFGHIIHFAYGSYGSGFQLDSVQEGFADHNVLRYGLYRRLADSERSHDQFTIPLGYDDGLDRLPSPATDWRIRPISWNGEWRPFNWTASEWECTPADEWCDPDGTATVYSGTGVCNPSSGWTYACGSMISQIYWELAWNYCKTGHGAHDTSVSGQRIVYCDLNDRIIRTGSYQGAPLMTTRLANRAFTYAIMTDPQTLQQYFEAVNSYYLSAYYAGWIGLDDYLRVKAVMNSHCLGWNNYCTDQSYRKTPGNLLPRMLTRKANLYSQSFPTSGMWGPYYPYPPHWPETFFTSSAGSRSSSTAVISFGLFDNTSYIRLDQTTDKVTHTVAIRTSGCYSFHASVYATPPSGDAMYLKVGASGTKRLWDVEDSINGYWWWTHFRDASGGTATVFLNRDTATYWPVELSYGEPLNVEALVVRKELSTTNPAACTYTP